MGVTALGRRRLPIVALAVVVLVAALVWFAADRRADAARAEAWRWQHGGDDVVVRAAVGVTDGPEYGDFLAATGAPRRRVLSHVGQAFVVEVAWEGGTSSHGSYQFMLLDRRVKPPAIVAGMQGWVHPKGHGTVGWHSSFSALAEHYPWLERTAPSDPDESLGDPFGDFLGSNAAWLSEPSSIGIRDREEGRATLAFWGPRGAVPVRDPSRDLVLAMVHFDGEVQWAKQVPLSEGLTPVP